MAGHRARAIRLTRRTGAPYAAALASRSKAWKQPRFFFPRLFRRQRKEGESVTDIVAAQDRLQRALSRLETAQRALIERPAAPQAQNGGEATSELIGSLAAVQRENTELTALAQAIGARLDKTIERIETILASEGASDGDEGDRA